MVRREGKGGGLVLPCRSLYKTLFKTSALRTLRKVTLIGDTQIKNEERVEEDPGEQEHHCYIKSPQ